MILNQPDFFVLVVVDLEFEGFFEEAVIDGICRF